MKRFCLVALIVNGGMFASHFAQLGNAQSTYSKIDSVHFETSSLETAAPSNFTQQARLEVTPSVGFGGGALAVSGDTAVGFSGAGYYVFVRTGTVWNQQAVLVPSDGLGVIGGFSPSTVAIEGDTVVFGGSGATINSNANQGAAYVFVRSGTTWTEQQRLTASDGAAGNRFGNSVAISNGTIVVGAYTATVNGKSEQGAAYAFVRNGTSWTEQAKILANDGAAGNNFGSNVALSGDTAVITRGYRTTAAVPNPAAYVFVRNGTAWSQQQKLSVCEPSGNGGSQCNFGNSISISGDNLAVGNAFLNVGNNVAQGGVYLFARSGTNWSQQQILTPDDGSANGLFGSSVSLANNTLLIGAQADIGFPGSAYIFNRTGSSWAQQQKLQINATRRDAFGKYVAMSGNTLIIAAPADAGAVPNFISAAYVYTSGAAPQVVHSPFDFDGDGKTDIGIYRPSVGEWWYTRSGNGGVFAGQFGASVDKIAPVDFTGDGKADLGFWRPSTGEWFVLRSEDGSYYSVPFGAPGDVPVPADYDGDGKADTAVFRPSTNTWYIQKSGGGTLITTFGAAGDVPVVSDYDGDGKADIAIYRPSAGQWWIDRSTAGLIAFQFGSSTDKPVQGDYTGDGKADAAFWRPSTGEWFVIRSEDFSFYSVPFGSNGDIPAPGDYDGDGRFDTTVFRPSQATWYAQRSTAGTLITQFGTAGDKPVANAFVP